MNIYRETALRFIPNMYIMSKQEAIEYAIQFDEQEIYLLVLHRPDITPIEALGLCNNWNHKYLFNAIITSEKLLTFLEKTDIITLVLIAARINLEEFWLKLLERDEINQILKSLDSNTLSQILRLIDLPEIYEMFYNPNA